METSMHNADVYGGRYSQALGSRLIRTSIRNSSFGDRQLIQTGGRREQKHRQNLKISLDESLVGEGQMLKPHTGESG